jgi:hypothetical protein
MVCPDHLGDGSLELGTLKETPLWVDSECVGNGSWASAHWVNAVSLLAGGAVDVDYRRGTGAE